MDLGWIVAFMLVGFDVLLVLVLNPFINRMYTDRLVKDVWNKKVELCDLNGDVIKVPVTRVIKDKDGNEVEQTEMVVAPLWYTILYGAGSMAATQVKMSLLSAKGKVSRDLNKMALMGEAGMNPATLAAIELLPNKYKGIALMLANYLGKGQPPGGPDQSSNRGKGVIE